MNTLQEKYRMQLEQLIEACQRSSMLGYGAGSGGNASYKVADDIILLTPTGIVKRKITCEDICFVNPEGSLSISRRGAGPRENISCICIYTNASRRQRNYACPSAAFNWYVPDGRGGRSDEACSAARRSDNVRPCSDDSLCPPQWRRTGLFL